MYSYLQNANISSRGNPCLNTHTSLLLPSYDMYSLSIHNREAHYHICRSLDEYFQLMKSDQANFKEGKGRKPLTHCNAKVQVV